MQTRGLPLVVGRFESFQNLFDTFLYALLCFQDPNAIRIREAIELLRDFGNGYNLTHVAQVDCFFSSKHLEALKRNHQKLPSKRRWYAAMCANLWCYC